MNEVVLSAIVVDSFIRMSWDNLEPDAIFYRANWAELGDKMIKKNPKIKRMIELRSKIEPR